MHVRSAVARACIKHAEVCAPEEACGVLLWLGDIAVQYLPAANVAADPQRRFEISLHLDQWNMVFDLEAERGLRWGPFHSHVRGPAVPSRADLAGVEGAHATRPYAIYSLATASWWLGTLAEVTAVR